MFGFDLVPVQGGDPIHLPPGETVLGRGPFLGVSDKRVSRLHGLLDNLNGQLRLKPTHLNPCFVQSSLSDEPRPLQKDSWFPLHDGDLFSLLPGQFIYKVVAVGGREPTPRNSQMFEEEDDKLPFSPKPAMAAVPVHGAPASSALLTEQEVDHPNTSFRQVESAQAEDVENGDVTPPVDKKRVLPAWMMAAAAAAAPTRPSSSLKVKERSKAGSSNRAAANQGPELREEEEGQEEEEEVRPRKKRRKMSSKEAAQSKADVASEQATVGSQCGPSRSEVSDESDTFTMEVEEEGKGNLITAPETGNKKPKHGRAATKPETSESEGSNGGSASAPSKARLRAPCPYGKDCYRKNPIHFQECSHPGDADYEEEDEEETVEADRPECPYGSDCYRKNPLHRKEFKHTRRPARATRAAPIKPEAGEGSDEEDTTTASLTTTARTWAMNRTTSRLTRMTAIKRTSEVCRGKQRGF
ncbi:hypothetical protein Q5P01_025788 [Channa striata]|uniref:PBZ-type domain-containing protein n=1 Tax=Channa striata TaxID=64152 RepID=A0AA88INA6_CHASR|nr:hypothetical protein Q5P01_025788 [Channa striata]